MIINLTETIPYEENGIVSKVLMEEEHGKVLLFSFDEGQNLSEHTNPHSAFAVILEGKAEISIKGEKYLLEEGNGIFMPANVPHGVIAKEKFKMLLIMIKKEGQA